jgi:hypothetical protein
MPRIAATVSLLALLAIRSTALADECFCLKHPSGAVLRGCEIRNDFYICTDPYTSKRSAVLITADWKRTECGADCFVVRRPAAPSVPRHEDDETGDEKKPDRCSQSKKKPPERKELAPSAR